MEPKDPKGDIIAFIIVMTIVVIVVQYTTLQILLR
jgi:hypothetical protein